MIGAKYVRDIENGEIVVITESGMESIKPFKKLLKDLVYLREFILQALIV